MRTRLPRPLSLLRGSRLWLPWAVFLVGCPDKSEPPAAASGSAPAAQAVRPPETLFVELKCRNCHGESSLFASALVNARSKPDEAVAMWILDAQKIRPGTGMPSFVELMSTQEALALARWIKAGNPAPAPAPSP